MSWHHMSRTRLITAAGAVALATGPAVADAPQVVASIKPVHSLVAGVMEGVATPRLVVQGAGSPHTYSLRPSDARALDQAEVVFWVGPDLETFLEKPLQALASDAEVVALGETAGLLRLPTREGGLWERHAHEGHDEEHAYEGHDEGHREEHHPHAHGQIDMHLWLDPRNAQVMVEGIALALSEVDPGNAATYRGNAARLRERLAELDTALAEKLAPVQGRPFLVFHDGYHYLEHRYGLAAAGSITVDPERRPGARRLSEIHSGLDELDVACVFAEPQFEPALVETVVGGTKVRTGVLDPLGVDLEAGPSQYFQLLDQLAQSLVDCLGSAQSG